MKIATWNINGLRSSVKMGFERWLLQAKNDIVCLQEAKTEEDLLSEVWFEGCKVHWNTAEKRGYSGVVTLVRSGLEVLSVEKGLAIQKVMQKVE